MIGWRRAKLFPDRLDSIALPYKRAYESAVALVLVLDC